MDEYTDFEQFWRHFLRSHENPAVRWCHVAATASLAAGVAGAALTRRVWPLLLGGGAALSLAVLSHPLFEGKWPENFGHPVWGVRAFLRLSLRTVTGSINAEIEGLERATTA